MSILGGNLINKISHSLHTRLVFVPRLNKSVVARDSKDRAYTNSLPVRYVPKKSRGVQKPEKPSENGGGNNTTINKDSIASSNNSDVFRYDESDDHEISSGTSSIIDVGRAGSKIYGYEKMIAREVDGLHIISGMESKTENHKSLSELSIDAGNGNHEDTTFDIGLNSELLEEPEYSDEELEFHSRFREDEHRGLQGCNRKLEAENSAVELLALRAYTALELRKKLNAKHFPNNIVDEVIHDFTKRGLINDCLYAEMFSRSRWSSSTWGPRRIKHELLKKGVSHDNVEKAVKLVFEDDEGGDEGSRVKLSKPSMDKLYLQASKQWLLGRDVPLEKRKARIVRWLQYRGFDWGVTSVIVKKLESQFST